MDICQNGGYAAILDMNEELASELVQEIGGGKTKFFETNVLETESIAAAVKGTLEWVKETGKEVGGVIAAAGGRQSISLSRSRVPFFTGQLLVLFHSPITLLICFSIYSSQGISSFSFEY